MQLTEKLNWVELLKYIVPQFLERLDSTSDHFVENSNCFAVIPALELLP